MDRRWHSRTVRVAAAAAVLLLAACDTDRHPTAIEEAPPPPPAFGAAAFHLTIDMATGRITVNRPASTRAPAGVSASLIGGDAIDLHTTNCTWSGGTGNSKTRRCTFDLAVRNLLAGTDLITPTSFPQPPAGTDGILVFPFAAAALGVPGGTATPSPDWDNPPANFFNDFSGCSGKASDCYRSETYPSPLHGGQMTEYRTVGFDVDKNAHSVSVYIVVAADLRDNPLLDATLIGSLAQCGNIDETTYLSDNSREVQVTLDIRTGQVENSTRRLVETAYCGFDLPATAVHGRIHQATLRLYHDDDTGNPYAQSYVVVDHMDFGATLDPDDLALDPLAENIGTLSTNATEEYKALDVTGAVQDDATNGRPRSQYRIRFAEPVVDAWVAFGYAGSSRPPELILLYRQY